MRLTFLFCFVFLLSRQIQSQNINDSLIVSVNTDDKNDVASIKQYIKGVSGVSGVFYCNNHNVYLVIAGLPEGSPTLIDIIKKQFPAFTVETKSGSVSELFRFCSFNDPADGAAIKAGQ